MKKPAIARTIHRTALMLLLCLVIGCGEAGRSGGEAAAILDAGQYSYSTSKSAIPKAVIGYLDSIHGRPFRIGDAGDSDRINLTDVIFSGREEYHKKLSFVLADSARSLLVYAQGGISVVTVVEYLRYDGPLRYLRYETFDRLKNIFALRAYLCSDPKPVSGER